MNEQIYTRNQIEIRTVEIDKGLFIKWENKRSDKGNIQIFRRNGSFSKDLFSESENGILVINSHMREGETIDYLDENLSYYYTVNYKYPVVDIVTSLFVGGKDNLYDHIARFSARLSKLKNKSQLTEYLEEKSFEAAKKKIDNEFTVDEEIDALKVDMEKRKRLAKARDQFAKEFLDGKDPGQLDEEDRKMYHELMELIDFQIKQFTIRK